MGTYCDYIPCPKCGADEAYREEHLGSGDLWLTCHRCGYYYERNGTHYPEHRSVIESGGFGSIAETFRNGVGRQSGFSRPMPLARKLAYARFRSKSRRVIALSVTHKVRGRWITIDVKTPPKRLKLRDFRTHLHADIASTSPPPTSYAADDTFDDSIPF